MMRRAVAESPIDNQRGAPRFSYDRPSRRSAVFAADAEGSATGGGIDLLYPAYERRHGYRESCGAVEDRSKRHGPPGDQ
jgi:hypothetical protein